MCPSSLTSGKKGLRETAGNKLRLKLKKGTLLILNYTELPGKNYF
jgi:hypothetical protein